LFLVSYSGEGICVKNMYLQHQVAEVLFNWKKFTHMDFIRKTGWVYSFSSLVDWSSYWGGLHVVMV